MKLIIAALGVILLVVGISSSIFVLKNRIEKPAIEGVSTVITPTPTASTNTSPSPTPTPKTTIKKPVSIASPTPTPTLTQSTQPIANATPSLAKDAACKSEAESKKNAWISQELSNLKSQHPDFYSYEAAVAMDPGQFSSQYDPQGAYEHWLIYSNSVKGPYESDIYSTGDQLYDVYYAQCMSK